MELRKDFKPLPADQIEENIYEFNCWLQKRKACQNTQCHVKCQSLIEDRFCKEVNEFRRRYPLESLKDLPVERLAYNPKLGLDSFFYAVSGLSGNHHNTDLMPYQYRLYCNSNGKICYGRGKYSVTDSYMIEERRKEIVANITKIVGLGENYLKEPKFGMLREIYAIPMGAAIKGKIIMLYTYQEGDIEGKEKCKGWGNHLNVYSEEHLDRIIEAFPDLTRRVQEEIQKQDEYVIKRKNTLLPERKREIIMDCKLAHPIMKDWHLFEFAEFVYTVYPNIFEGNKSAFRNPKTEKQK